MPFIQPVAIIKHFLMFILAFLMPPFYLILKRKYLIALVVTIIMVVLANWKAYGPIFAMGLCALAELIQIGVKLYFHIMYTDEPEDDGSTIVDGRLYPRPKK